MLTDIPPRVNLLYKVQLNFNYSNSDCFIVHLRVQDKELDKKMQLAQPKLKVLSEMCASNC
jgi:hypothetical protein